MGRNKDPWVGTGRYAAAGMQEGVKEEEEVEEEEGGYLESGRRRRGKMRSICMYVAR